MGQWEEFCVICGGPRLVDPARDTPLNRNTPLSTDWLSEWCGVTPEQPDVPIDIGRPTFFGCFVCDCFSASCPEPNSSHLHISGAADTFATYGVWLFRIRPQEEAALKAAAESSSNNSNNPRMAAAGPPKCGGQWGRYGVAFHRACGQLLQQRLGYAINFNHIWPLLEQQYCKDPDNACSGYFFRYDYGGTQRYQGQYFAFDSSGVEPEDAYLLLDPRQCRCNADRIVRVWQPLVQQFRGQQAVPGTAAAAQTSAASASAAALPTRGSAPAVQASAASLDLSKVDDTTQAVLQLVLTHTDQQQQLQLAALLLPLCRSMPQVLAGQLQLCVTANTVARADAASAWLAKYAVLVSLLQLEVCVDCCEPDMQAATRAVGSALAAAASNNQGLKLASYKGTCSSTADLEQLLQHLPLHHLTQLHISGTCSLSPAAATALTAATALQELSIPGEGLAASLAAEDGSPGSNSLAAVLSVSLQRLSLTDAGGCSHEDLLALRQQLAALTELRLCNNPPGSRSTHEGPTKVSSEAWSILPIRSLQFGTRQLPEYPGYIDMYPDTYLCLDSIVLGALSRMTGLTQLTLGPSVAFRRDFEMSQLTGPLQQLCSLQDLCLTPAVGDSKLIGELWQGLDDEDEDEYKDEDEDEDADPSRVTGARAMVVSACGVLAELRCLAVDLCFCSGHLAQLASATKLTVLDLYCHRLEGEDNAAISSLQKTLPNLVVRLKPPVHH